MKNQGLKFASMFLLIALMACGVEPRNRIILQIAGADNEYSLKNTICEAYSAFSGANSLVRCEGRFQTTGAVSDGVSFEFFDAYYINQNLGLDLALAPSTVWPRVTLDGIERGVVDGYVNVSEISNFSGGRVCFQFFLILTNSTVQGNFCDNVAVGTAY